MVFGGCERWMKFNKVYGYEKPHPIQHPDHEKWITYNFILLHWNQLSGWWNPEGHEILSICLTEYREREKHKITRQDKISSIGCSHDE